MPIGKTLRVNVGKNSELSRYFLEDDPEAIFIDQREIGHGSFGAVYYARNNLNNEVVAVKKMNFSGKQTQEQWQDIIREVKFLYSCDHENCIRYKGCYLKDQTCWLVMDYCLGSASDIIEVHKAPLQEVEIQSICHGALSGLVYLHGNGRIHRDIKAGNILLTERGCVKLADFGSASLRSPANSFVGTPFWMAPEVILAMDEGQYDGKVDIWSMGITCIEMAERKPPLFHMNAMSALYHIAQIDPPRLAHPEEWSNGFQKLVTRCLQKAPEDRPTALDLLQDEFLCSCQDQYGDVLYQLVQRTKEAVQLLDNQNYRRLQKMLMSTGEEGEEQAGENDDIESEPPSDAGMEECSGFSPSFSSHSPSPSPEEAHSSLPKLDGHVRRTRSEENTHKVSDREAQSLVQRATAPELSIQNHTSSSGSRSQQHRDQHRSVLRTQSESVTLDVKHKDMTSTRLKSEASLLKRSESKNPRSEHRRSDHLTAAEEVARKVTGTADGFSTLRSHFMVSRQAAEWQLQSELKEQMQGYKRMRQTHKGQMQVLESRHKSELSTHYKSQERELEQLKSTYDRDLERFRSRQRAELDQRLKHEANEERKFSKLLKDKRDIDMKRFMGQQKVDYRNTKNLFKVQLEENQRLSNAQRKAMLDERKKELLAQQKFSENEHLQILDTMTRHERVEFQQNLVQERQAFQKALLQEELNVMQSHKDQVQEMRRRHLCSTIELQYHQLQSLHDVRMDHLSKQHASEWDNQLAYSKKADRELRKKHVLELKEHPKSLKMSESQIKRQYHNTVRIQQKQYKALQKQMIATVPKERHREVLRQTKEEQMRKIAMLALQYERTIADMAQKQTVKIDETQLKEQEALRKQLQQEQDLLQTFQEAQDQKLKVQHERERRALDEKVELSKKELEKEILEESSKLQNMRLERQQALQKKHLRELKEFAEAYSNDKLLPSSQRERQNSEQGSLSSEQSHTSSQTSIGKVSL